MTPGIVVQYLNSAYGTSAVAKATAGPPRSRWGGASAKAVGEANLRGERGPAGEDGQLPRCGEVGGSEVGGNADEFGSAATADFWNNELNKHAAAHPAVVLRWLASPWSPIAGSVPLSAANLYMACWSTLENATSSPKPALTRRRMHLRTLADCTEHALSIEIGIVETFCVSR